MNYIQKNYELLKIEELTFELHEAIDRAIEAGNHVVRAILEREVCHQTLAWQRLCAA